MKAIPNVISFSRIVFSTILIFIKPLSIAFYVIYIICGFSDIMDGFIARKIDATSELGAKLDSIADMIMVGVLLFVFYPIVNTTIQIFVWASLIAIIRLSAMIVAMQKYKIFAMLHTYGNKITGMVLYIFPLLIPFIGANVIVYICCIVASISAIEELVIQLTSSELQVNIKSIFSR